MRLAQLWIIALALLAAAPGCRHPMRVMTDSRVNIPEPVQANIVARLGSPSECGPVVAMPVSGNRRRCAGRIALIDVDGILVNSSVAGLYASGENPVAAFQEKLAAVERDPCVGAVVLRINSPGGGVVASQIMRHELEAFRQRTGRPVVACLMDVGAGGAYYLATACDAIYAQPGTVTGGIGVIFNAYNLRDAMAQLNIAQQAVKSGDYIDLGNAARGLNEESRDMLQEIADEFHEQFIENVENSRPIPTPVDPTTFDGRIFTASQAIDRGLVDRIGPLDEAIATAREMAGQPEAGVVMYQRESHPVYSMYGSSSNVPLQATLSLLNIPGIERSRLPTFLYMWQPEPTLERMGGN